VRFWVEVHTAQGSPFTAEVTAGSVDRVALAALETALVIVKAHGAPRGVVGRLCGGFAGLRARGPVEVDAGLFGLLASGDPEATA